MGILFAFLTAFVTAGFNVFIKKGMTASKGKSNGFLITVIINVLIHGIILACVMVLKGLNASLTWDSFIMFALGGVLSTILGRSLLLTSINWINPSRASAIKNSTPMFTIILAITVLGEDLTLISMVGLLLILFSLFLQGTINFIESRTYKSNDWNGYLLAVIAAIVFAVGQVFRKSGLNISNEPFLGTFVGSLVALIVIIIFRMIRSDLKSYIKENLQSINLNFVIASVFLSFGPLFFLLGASKIQVSYVSVIAGIEPLLTIFLSAFLLKGNEIINKNILVTSLFVMVGTAFIVIGTE